MWNAPCLVERARVEFSSRLRRSLGLCYPQRDLIRINPVLLKAGNREMLDETLVHEAAHTSLDPTHASSAGWLAAQAADGVFISTYAADHPLREDVAESFLTYLAVRYRSDRMLER